MKKSTLLAVFLLVGVSLNAQIAFYLRPTIITKTNQSKLGLGWENSPTHNTISNEYFSFENKSQFYNSNLDFGINLGVQVKEKHFYELGWSRDHSSILGSILSHSTVKDQQTGEEFQTEMASSVYNTFKYSRISADYRYNFWSNQKQTIQLQSLVGFGLLMNKNDGLGSSTLTLNPLNSGSEIGTGVYINENFAKSQTYYRNTMYLKFGLGMDFRAKNNEHLFALDLSYLYGTRDVQYANNKIIVRDNGVDKKYLYTQSSKGSGVYLTLSRRFQVYPWIPLKNKSDKI